MKEKTPKTKAEKRLNKITWWWVALSVLLDVLFFGIVYIKPCILEGKMVIYRMLCLVAFLLIPLSFLLACVAAFRKSPKIRARVWLWVMFKNILALIILLFPLLLDYVTSASDDPYWDDKPIIYLYPQGPTEVTVELGKPENLTHTYPKYDKLWTVIARPGGELTDSKTGRHYYALYWEGKNTVSTPEMTEGFVVEGKKTIPFLEEKLAKLGLTDREAEEFIVYWLPKMESNAYNYVRFQTMEEQEENMPLTVSPPPTTLIRVMMEFKVLDEPIEVKEQVLPQTPERTGFVVVEWGGTEL